LEVEGSLIVNDSELSIRAAVEGIGFMYTLEDYVARMMADGRLICPFEDSALPRLDGFFLYYPSRRQNPAALQVLIDYLRANLRLGARSVKENV